MPGRCSLGMRREKTRMSRGGWRISLGTRVDSRRYATRCGMAIRFPAMNRRATVMGPLTRPSAESAHGVCARSLRTAAAHGGWNGGLNGGGYESRSDLVRVDAAERQGDGSPALQRGENGPPERARRGATGGLSRAESVRRTRRRAVRGRRGIRRRTCGCDGAPLGRGCRRGPDPVASG